MKISRRGDALKRRNLLAQRYRDGVTLRDLEREFERTRGTITAQLRALRRAGHDLADRTPHPAASAGNATTRRDQPMISTYAIALAVALIAVALVVVGSRLLFPESRARQRHEAARQREARIEHLRARVGDEELQQLLDQDVSAWAWGVAWLQIMWARVLIGAVVVLAVLIIGPADILRSLNVTS
jgi:DNA-binding MarR family transcriptional regulator